MSQLLLSGSVVVFFSSELFDWHVGVWGEANTVNA